MLPARLSAAGARAPATSTPKPGDIVPPVYHGSSVTAAGGAVNIKLID